MPVGHVFVLHFRAWIHPSEKRKDLAALQTSAPNAKVLYLLRPGRVVRVSESDVRIEQQTRQSFIYNSHRKP